MLNKLTKIKRLLLIGKEIWHNKRLYARPFHYLPAVTGAAGRF